MSTLLRDPIEVTIIDWCTQCCSGGVRKQIRCYNCLDWFSISKLMWTCQICNNTGIKCCQKCKGNLKSQQKHFFYKSVAADLKIIGAKVYYSPLGKSQTCNQTFSHYQIVYQLQAQNKKSIYMLTSFGTGQNKGWEVLFSETNKLPLRRRFNQTHDFPKLKSPHYKISDIRLKTQQFCGKYDVVSCNCQTAVRVQWQTFFQGKCPI